MTYTLAPHVKAEMLEKEGFEITLSIDSKYPIHGTRKIDDSREIFVNLWVNLRERTLSDNHYNSSFDITPHIQDLIQKGYVIENG